MSQPSKTEDLAQLAQEAAECTQNFFVAEGPGPGNRKTNEFMQNLRAHVRDELGYGYEECRICGEDTKLAVDFFIPEEQTVVEVALGLRNSNTEFERDILKVLVAKERGHHVERLLFLSKPGAKKKCEQSSAGSFIEWVRRVHSVEIEVRELTDSHAV